MKYTSTRTNPEKLSFDDVVLAGLAPDGGLYLPESIPAFTAAEIESMRGLSYPQLACRIMLPFMGSGWDEARLMPIVEKSYANFRHTDIAPLVKLSPQHHVLELFHGPTLAFKDFALQFLGNLLADILSRNHQRVTVIGATSGDTGSAAIAGLAGHDNIQIHIMYPQGRVSDVQRRQMTTVAAKNVHALAVEGTFDDCQAIVKTLFQDADFNAEHNLVAVNSINWARIMAQIVYYFYAALALGAPQKSLSFSVPTGNFGDIYAGWLAKQMGLPIAKLLIATNENDILARCWQSGNYEMRPVKKTLSPSMDIQISSNFERLLSNYYDGDGAAIDALMHALKADKYIGLSAKAKASLEQEFAACAVSNAATQDTIKTVFDEHGYVLDPHTATGVYASEQYLARSAGADGVPDDVMVTLATAHPAKFPEAVMPAIGLHPELPPHMADLFEREERSIAMANDIAAVKAHITRHSLADKG